MKVSAEQERRNLGLVAVRSVVKAVAQGWTIFDHHPFLDELMERPNHYHLRSGRA
jgi:hypothetical protein